MEIPEFKTHIIRRETFALKVRVKDERAWALVRGEEGIQPRIYPGGAYHPGFRPQSLYRMQKALARLVRRQLRKHGAVHVGNTKLRWGPYYRYNPTFFPPYDPRFVMGMSVIHVTTWAFRQDRLPEPHWEDQIRMLLRKYPVAEIPILEPISIRTCDA